MGVFVHVEGFVQEFEYPGTNGGGHAHDDVFGDPVDLVRLSVVGCVE